MYIKVRVMKLSAKIEYAYKAVLELALQYRPDTPVQAGVVARAHKIPPKFLIQILLRLKNAHIVNSSRGIAGGYYLARPPSQISLAAVVSAVDETVVDARGGKPRGRMSEADRLLAGIWDQLNAGIKSRLEEITFEYLIAQTRKEKLVYQI